MNKNTPIYHVVTLDQYFAQSVVLPRFITLLLSGFAGLALLLACLGVYGVVSYVATQRTHKIGIRMALGSQRGDVLRIIIGEGLRAALLGRMAEVKPSLAMGALFNLGARDGPSTLPIL